MSAEPSRPFLNWLGGPRAPCITQDAQTFRPPPCSRPPPRPRSCFLLWLRLARAALYRRNADSHADRFFYVATARGAAPVSSSHPLRISLRTIRVRKPCFRRTIP